MVSGCIYCDVSTVLDKHQHASGNGSWLRDLAVGLVLTFHNMFSVFTTCVSSGSHHDVSVFWVHARVENVIERTRILKRGDELYETRVISCS